ncbi:unnamed protein product, partial [Closterium sp. Naga37s-1]
MGLCSSSLDDDTPAPLHPTYHPSQPTSIASNLPPTSSPHFTSPQPPPHLPPECIALILSHLPPTAICRLASVSKAWAAAAALDTCWARLLPHAFAPKLLLDRSSSFSDPLKRPSSKKLFQALCRGVFLDAGRIQVKEDPGTGMISTSLFSGNAPSAPPVTGVERFVFVVSGRVLPYLGPRYNLRSPPLPSSPPPKPPSPPPTNI